MTRLQEAADGDCWASADNLTRKAEKLVLRNPVRRELHTAHGWVEAGQRRAPASQGSVDSPVSYRAMAPTGVPRHQRTGCLRRSSPSLA